MRRSNVAATTLRRAVRALAAQLAYNVPQEPVDAGAEFDSPLSATMPVALA